MSVAPTLEELKDRILSALKVRHWRSFESDVLLDLGLVTPPSLEWSEATNILGPQAKRFYGDSGGARLLEIMEQEESIIIVPSPTRRMRYILLPETAQAMADMHSSVPEQLALYEFRLKKAKEECRDRVAAMKAEDRQNLVEKELEQMKRLDKTPKWTMTKPKP